MPLGILYNIIVSLITSLIGTLTILYNTFQEEFHAVMAANAHLLPAPQPDPVTSDDYHPASALDVYKAYHVLHRDCNLPAELSILILDFAKYHLRSITSSKGPGRYGEHSPVSCCITHSMINEPSNTGTSNTRLHPKSARVVKIVLTTRSHDQGWSDDSDTHGTYDHSWTWFDLIVRRYPSSVSSEAELRALVSGIQDQDVIRDHIRNKTQDATRDEDRSPSEVVVHEDRVVTNVHALSETTEHRVVFVPAAVDCEYIHLERQDDGRGAQTIVSVKGRKWLSDVLRPGHTIELHAKAAFPGWINHVESARVEVYVSVL